MESKYYALLPAPVRYSKNLSATEKIVYAELSAMADSKGFCSPTNPEIAESLNITRNTISLAISALQKHGFIQTYLADNHIRTIQIKQF
jgi:DNA-binding MarR family transcriptional regulator